jgi:putative transposase
VSAIQAEANNHRLAVRAMCRILGVSHSGVLRLAARLPSGRAGANGVLTEQIRQLHLTSDETYGMPRIRAQLRQDGYPGPGNAWRG